MKKILIMMFVIMVGLMFIACPPPVPELPTFDPEAGEYDPGTEITISTATEGAKIFYTLDGTDPATQPGPSTYEYDDANKPTITRANAPLTIRALSYSSEDDTSSEVVEAVYTVTPEEFTLEVIIDGNGTVTVTDDGETLTGTGPWSIVIDSEVVLEATPGDASTVFLGWSGSGIDTTDNPYTIPAMDKDYSVTATFNAPTTEDFETGDTNPDVPWYNGFVEDTDNADEFESNVAPIVQTTTVNNGTYALQFGATSDDQIEDGWLTRSMAVVKIDVTAGSTVSFYYSTDCAPTVTDHTDSDGFRFYSNADIVDSSDDFLPPTVFAAGSTGWTQHTETFTDAGQYTLVFSYWNLEVGNSVGADTAYIDDIEFSAGVRFVDPVPAYMRLRYDGGLVNNGDTETVTYSDAYPTTIDFNIENQFGSPDAEANLWLTGDPDLIQLTGALAADFSVTATPLSDVVLREDYFTVEGTPSTSGQLVIEIPFTEDYGATSDTFTVTFDITAETPAIDSLSFTQNEGMAFPDGTTTFTLEVSALDQFGMPFVPDATNSVTLTQNLATYTLGGTLTKNFDGTNAFISFDDLTLSGTGGDTAVFTATEADNSFTATTSVAVVGTQTFPYTTTFIYTDGWREGDPSDDGVYVDGWAYAGTADYFFHVGNGGTTSYNTGPQSGHTTGDPDDITDMYLYGEASDGDEGDIAILISPHVDLSTATQPVLSFWWHMFGDDFDDGATAHVDIWDGSAWVEIWTMTGNQGDAWNNAFIDVSAYTDGLIRFSINKAGFAQDWAIDDFAIEEYTTPVSEFKADKLTAYTNAIVQLTDQSTMLPTSWAWTITGPGTVTYENGTDSTSQNPAFSTDTPGSYTVELTAANSLGTGTTETKTDYIFIVSSPADNPITFPESFEGDGTWGGLTTGNNIIPDDPGANLTFDNTSAYDGTYSIHFFGPQSGDDVSSITFGMDAITGESLSFYFDAIAGSGAAGYSVVYIYELTGSDQIEIDSFDVNDYSGSGWTQWSSPAYTADEPKVYKIEFFQDSSISDMEIYIDLLDQGVITLD